MSGLRPEGRLEGFDETARRVASLVERWKHQRPIGRRSVFERYVDGSLRPHVHLRESGDDAAGQSHTREWCLTFERPGVSFLDDVERNVRRLWKGLDWRDVSQLHKAGSENDFVVLVEVPEIVQYRERFPFRRCWPCLVGLR